MIQIKILKLDGRAKVPERAHDTDAGFDIFALDEGLIRAHDSVAIDTGIAIEMPLNFYGEIHARSSWFRENFDADGVIDSGYRGEIKVMLHNEGKHDKYIHAGDKLAQIIFHRIPEVELVEVQELSDSDRGTGGFGSSGR